MRNTIHLTTFAALCLFAPIALTLSPRDGEAVAVVAAPWSGGSALHIVAAAGGRLLNATNHLAIGIDKTPGFISRLYAAGALLVIDAAAASFCLRLARRAPAALMQGSTE